MTWCITDTKWGDQLRPFCDDCVELIEAPTDVYDVDVIISHHEWESLDRNSAVVEDGERLTRLENGDVMVERRKR